ncbi:MAG TPA: ABC transporter permease [Acidimicrobiales bacterium]|nr:ABC transporter permease [Acidimicrobiales bacterium]
MTSYVARRILQSIVVVIGVTLIVFIVIHLLPGGARALLGPHVTPQALHAFMVQNGYTKPIFVQYAKYLDNLVHGNLGWSYHYNQSVGALLEQDLPKTALLVGLSYVLAIVLAIPVGLLQTIRRNKPSDYAVTWLVLVGYSLPPFWLGLLLIWRFAVALHIFPPEAPQGATIGSIVADPLGLVLPVLTLSVVSIATFSRFVRSSSIDNLAEDYVRTARASGASERRVLLRHVLRNSVTPVITIMGLNLPNLVSGAILVEALFNYPGMGLLFWTSATDHDYPVLMGFTVVVGIVTVAGNLLADIAYAWADPRIRYS